MLRSSLRRSFPFTLLLALGRVTAPAPLFADGETRDRPGRAELRLQHLVDEQAAGERARVVDPAWRTVERSLAGAFHPPRAAVTDKSGAQLLIAQYRAALRRGAIDGRLGAGDPSEWTRVEIEARVDGHSKLLEARVVSPSGKAALAALALESVRAAVANHPPAPAAGAARVRFSVGAAVAVTPPESVALVPATADANHAAAIKLGRWQFDESGVKSHGVDFVFGEHVLTDVQLVGVTRE